MGRKEGRTEEGRKGKKGGRKTEFTGGSGMDKGKKSTVGRRDVQRDG